MKTSSDYLTEANHLVPRLSPEAGIHLHAAGQSVFIDVRDSATIAQTGTILGALCIPRGLIEFAADPATPFHNPALTHEADIILVCGVGAMAALAGKTLKEMGYQHVRNGGGFADWQAAGGPIHPPTHPPKPSP